MKRWGPDSVEKPALGIGVAVGMFVMAMGAGADSFEAMLLGFFMTLVCAHDLGC